MIGSRRRTSTQDQQPRKRSERHPVVPSRPRTVKQRARANSRSNRSTSRDYVGIEDLALGDAGEVTETERDKKTQAGANPYAKPDIFNDITFTEDMKRAGRQTDMDTSTRSEAEQSARQVRQPAKQQVWRKLALDSSSSTTGPSPTSSTPSSDSDDEEKKERDKKGAGNTDSGTSVSSGQLENGTVRLKRRTDGRHGIKFEIHPSTFAEDLDHSAYVGRPQQYVLDNARIKAEQVLSASERPPDILIGCDTVVTLDDVILEKPADLDHAKTMLKKLSGRWHQVHSGVAVICPSGMRTLHRCTEVEFMPLTDDIIDCYLQLGESLDKAGAYGIQGYAGALVKGIKGDYYNVMGLPLNDLFTCLRGL